jgi:hypothetical protein
MTKNKPTVAIFGDSFADPTWVNNDYLSWPELLTEQYDVTNYAMTGTSLWWSYNLFLEHYKKYDKCIFVVTVPGRIHIESTDKHLNLNPNTWPVWDGIPIGELYFRLFYSEKRETCFHKFMVNDILTADNVLVIPAFSESVPELKSWSLCHFADIELYHYGLVHPGSNENRKCHLSIENNQMVYNKITTAIAVGDKILQLSKEDFVVPTKPLEFYWK